MLTGVSLTAVTLWEGLGLPKITGVPAWTGATVAERDGKACVRVS